MGCDADSSIGEITYLLLRLKSGNGWMGRALTKVNPSAKFDEDAYS